jgi:hypothetical protein
MNNEIRMYWLHEANSKSCGLSLLCILILPIIQIFSE